MNHDKPQERLCPCGRANLLNRSRRQSVRSGGEDRNVLLEIELEPGGGVSTQDVAILERLGDV